VALHEMTRGWAAPDWRMTEDPHGSRAADTNMSRSANKT
jgi:hypothetical protein